MSVYQMSAEEVYETYVNEVDPSTLLSEGRDAVAHRLIHDREMPEKAAYYAADQILLYAENAEEGSPQRPGPNLDSGEYR